MILRQTLKRQMIPVTKERSQILQIKDRLVPVIGTCMTWETKRQHILRVASP